MEQLQRVQHLCAVASSAPWGLLGPCFGVTRSKDAHKNFAHFISPPRMANFPIPHPKFQHGLLPSFPSAHPLPTFYFSLPPPHALRHSFPPCLDCFIIFYFFSHLILYDSLNRQQSATYSPIGNFPAATCHHFQHNAIQFHPCETLAPLTLRTDGANHNRKP